MASAGAWISSADAKAVALLTVAGALLAVIAAAVAGLMAASPTFRVSASAGGAFAVFCAASVGSVACSVWAVMPRCNRRAVLSSVGWKQPLSHSRTFFADLAALSPAQFLAMLEEPGASLDERDLREQAFVLQHVAASKMRAIRRAVVLLGLGLVALGAFLCEFVVVMAC